MESKQYTVVSKQNIELWIDSVGSCKVADEVFDILSEDVTYRLRDLVHNSLKYMKHSKRTCLTVDDLNYALKESDTEPLFGHSGSDDLSFKTISAKEGTKVCYLDEKDLNLREAALDSSVPTEPGEIGLKASWLVLEGHYCSSGRVRDDTKSTLTEPSASYLHNVTSALIGKGSQLRKVALGDLKSNNKLQIIIPHLVSFCSSQVVQLAKMMLFILLEAKMTVTKWFIKDKASSVLASLSRRNSNASNNLKEQLLKSYTESFNDASKPMGYFYGAVVGIKELGISAVCQGLYPKAREKLKLIDSKISAASSHSEKTELVAVLNAITDALAMLYMPRFESCHLVMQRRKSQSFSSLHRELTDVVGESFLVRCFTTNHRCVPSTTTTTKNVNQQNPLTTPMTNKNSPSVKETLKTADKLEMHIDKPMVDNTVRVASDTVVIRENKYTLQSTVGNLIISSKWRKSKVNRNDYTDDAESAIFNRLPTRLGRRQKVDALRGTHTSLGKKKKKISDLLSRISIQLPNI